MSEEQSSKDSSRISKRQKRINRRSTIMTLLAAVIFATVTVYVLQKTIMPFSDYQQIKPKSPALAVELLVYRKLGNAGYQRIQKNTLQPGDRLAFAINTTQPIHVALAASMQNQPAFSIFEGAKIPPGAGRKLEKGGQRYIYQFEQRDAPLKFCLIYAADAELLLNKLQQLPQSWQATPAAACWSTAGEGNNS